MQRVHGQGSGWPGGPAERLVTVGAYVMLLALGLAEGLVGSFQYSRALGSVPVAAVSFALLIGVTCVLGAWGMHQPMGGLLPAVGWLVASFFLARGTPGGSVLITNTSAGQWFLFGGAACALGSVVTGFVRWSPRRLGAFPGSGAWEGEIPPGTKPSQDGNAAGRELPAAQPAASGGQNAEGSASGGAEIDGRDADSRKPDR
jgi:hypothetical protein